MEQLAAILDAVIHKTPRRREASTPEFVLHWTA
jgi:hypothetical protein